MKLARCTHREGVEAKEDVLLNGKPTQNSIARLSQRKSSFLESFVWLCSSHEGENDGLEQLLSNCMGPL
eukprot:122598-Amphidinium_carterae.1